LKRRKCEEMGRKVKAKKEEEEKGKSGRNETKE